MSNFFYDGRFKIEKINYENLLNDFNIYILEVDKVKLDYEKERATFIKAMKNLENLKTFYLENSLYLLGNRDFILKDEEFIKKYLVGIPKKISEKKSLEKISPIIILNLLIRYLPYEIIVPQKENPAKFVDTKYIMFFLKEKEKNFKFLSCSFEKYKFGEEYILRLDQKTFTHKDFFKKEKKYKVSFDLGTRIFIPDKNGEYYEGNPFSKTIETSFIVRKIENIGKLKSYYFTSIMDIIRKYLNSYISLKFNLLKDFEHYKIKGKKIYFGNSVKNLKRDIELYVIKDIKDGVEIVAKEDKFFELLEKFRLKNIEFKFKGVADIGMRFEDIERWKIFLLNSDNGEDLEYDGYREIKKSSSIVSEGFYLNLEAEEIFDVKLTRTVEELFIKEQIKKRDISKLHSEIDIFDGVSCIHYKNGKIRKIIVLNNGKIEIDLAKIYEENKLSKEFKRFLKEFDIDFSKSKDSAELKFMKINDKKIHIVDIPTRIYYNTNQFIKECNEKIEQGKKGISKSLNGFLGMSMDIRINKKEQLYYSFYDTGIRGNEIFSPNIKKILSDKPLTKEEFDIFCESLVFRYLSNPAKLQTYPFFFKLTSEMS